MFKKLLCFITLLIPYNITFANGYLMLIGGHLEASNKMIWQKMKEIATNSSNNNLPLACIWVTNTGDPDGSAKYYSNIFKQYHMNSKVIPIYFNPDMKPDWKDNQNSRSVAKLITECNIYFFTGGDQSRTTNVLFNADGSESLALKTLKQELNKNKLVAGTSAGDMMQSNPMITGGYYDEKNHIDTVKLGKGLGLLEPNKVIVDSHFSQRNRLPRLINAMEKAEINTGIGVDEATSIIIEVDKNGKSVSHWQAIGINRVIIIELPSNEKQKMKITPLTNGQYYEN